MNNYDTKTLPEGQLEICQDGFRFVITLQRDTIGGCLYYLGEFTDKFEEGAIAHDHDDSSSYNWFVPANVPDTKWFSEQGMSEKEACLAAGKQAMKHYKLAATYYEDWEYYVMLTKVYVDSPESERMFVCAQWLTGIDVWKGKVDEDRLSALIAGEIHEVTPIASKKLERFMNTSETASTDSELLMRDLRPFYFPNEYRTDWQWAAEK